MNRTHLGAIKHTVSAFAFLKHQVETYRKQQLEKQKRYRVIAKHAMATTVAFILTSVTTLPTETTLKNAELELKKPFETSLRLDKNHYSLLVIEEAKVEIKVGKSLAQEQAEAEARARALATQIRGVPRSGMVYASEAATAHQLAQEAAAKAGIPEYWRELAAIWQVESGKAIHSCVVSRADGRAVGPMQFMPGTFRSYAADGDGDGQADICNAKDALVAAGHLLKRGGIAEGNVDGAIHNYNHSMAYVRKVKTIANGID